VSQADLSIHGQVSRTSATEIMTAPAFAVPAKKMAMWLFIIADCATFAGCLFAYGFTRNATPDWPRPFHSITNVGAHDAHLLTSSLTHADRSKVRRAGRQSGAFRWIMITAVLGILFAVLPHSRVDWNDFEGATLFHNPWAHLCSVLLFFSITGLHLLHVTGGVVRSDRRGYPLPGRTLQC